MKVGLEGKPPICNTSDLNEELGQVSDCNWEVGLASAA